MTEWWSAQQSGLIGGLAGAVFGILGGTVGALVGIFAPKGIGRKPLLIALTIILIKSVGVLITGIVAVLQHQPYHVYYPLLLIGLISTGIFASLYPVIRNRFRQADQRKLDAESLRRS